MYDVFDYINQQNFSNYLNIFTLISFFGGRHIISDFYDHRPDLICNPVVKTIVLFSIIYMNIKHLKLTIVVFFLYIYFIDSYVTNKCNPDYISNATPKNHVDSQTQTIKEEEKKVIPEAVHVNSTVLSNNIILSTIE